MIKLQLRLALSKVGPCLEMTDTGLPPHRPPCTVPMTSGSVTPPSSLLPSVLSLSTQIFCGVGVDRPKAGIAVQFKTL